MIELTEYEILWVKKQVEKKRQEKEDYQKGAIGLMEAYKANYECYLKRMEEYNKLSPAKKFFTKKPVYS